MKLKSIGIIFQTLNESGVKYLLAGGLAVVAHGYVRFTADVDIILGMDETNLKRAMYVFDSLGFKPRAPVDLFDFVSYEKRNEWIKGKGLTVFSLWNPEEPATEVDIFVESPVDFTKAYSECAEFNFSNDINVKVLSLDDLIFIKRQAGRPKDFDDIDKLNIIYKDKK